MAPYISSKSLEAPRSKIDSKDVIYTVFSAAKLKVLVHTPSEVDAVAPRDTESSETIT